MDSGVREGDEISMFYDPMIAKLITWGKDRDTALDVHGEALDRFHIEGIQDNIPFIAAVMDEKRFRSGNITTAYIKDEFPDGFDGVPPTKTAGNPADLCCRLCARLPVAPRGADVRPHGAGAGCAPGVDRHSWRQAISRHAGSRRRRRCGNLH
jgi:acetyl/propionyl-CoA carboxylase alpha subunit